MVLFIKNEIVTHIPENLQEFVSNYSNLLDEAKQFTSKPVELVDPLYSLYVEQQEFAVIPSNDDIIKVVGSDEATTCHILILKSSHGSIAVAHFDGSDNESQTFENMVMELRTVDGQLEELNAYVLGGYRSVAEDNMLKVNDSESISMNILKCLKTISCSVNLALWCTVDSNTKIINQKPFPIFYGLAINRETGRVFPASFPTPMPCHILRSAMLWVCSPRVKTNIYNYKNKSLLISPCSGWHQDYFKFHATLSNDMLLRYCSTSPLVEPPSFCPRLKKVFYLLGKYSGKDIFPNNAPRVYKMNSVGEWIEQ